MQVLSAITASYLIVGVIIGHFTWLSIKRANEKYEEELKLARMFNRRDTENYLNIRYREVALLMRNKNSYMIIVRVYSLAWLNILIREVKNSGSHN